VAALQEELATAQAELNARKPAPDPEPDEGPDKQKEDIGE
jgi:hypothetical protein